MMNSTNWPPPNVWVLIAQLVEHCSANAEAMGSNPVEVPKFFRVNLQLLKIAITAATVISSFKKNFTLTKRLLVND